MYIVSCKQTNNTLQAGNSTFYNLIKIKDTVFASMVTYLMPVVAIVIGLSDGEIINMIQIGGMVLILTGVFINSKS